MSPEALGASGGASVLALASSSQGPSIDDDVQMNFGSTANTQTITLDDGETMETMICKGCNDPKCRILCQNLPTNPFGLCAAGGCNHAAVRHSNLSVADDDESPRCELHLKVLVSASGLRC